MAETMLLHVGDFPPALHDEVADRLAMSSVGFSTIQIVDNAEQLSPSGSGTLVRISGRLAILTADHVVDQLLEADRVSLLVDWTGKMRRCVFDRNELNFARLARGRDNGDGPDLALVLLPPGSDSTSTLIANKVFYDLDRRIQVLPGSYAGVEWGFWFPCGVPAEGAKHIGPAMGFSDVLAQWGLCAVAAQPTEFTHEGFDYLDLRVPDDAEDVPTRLNGMSGAGLWQVLFRRSTDGKFYVQDYVLSGVVFYEWYSPDRRLRCHGRQSIHEKVPELFQAYLSGSL